MSHLSHVANKGSRPIDACSAACAAPPRWMPLRRPPPDMAVGFLAAGTAEGDGAAGGDGAAEGEGTVEGDGAAEGEGWVVGRAEAGRVHQTARVRRVRAGRSRRSS